MPEFCMHEGALVTVLSISISITRFSQLIAFGRPFAVDVSTGQFLGACRLELARFVIA